MTMRDSMKSNNEEHQPNIDSIFDNFLNDNDTILPSEEGNLLNIATDDVGMIRQVANESPSHSAASSLLSTPSLSTLANSPYENIYPNWDVPSAPVSMNDINDIFLDFEVKFGFQHDNVRNMYDHLLTMLDSRSARMSPLLALWTLHADYIGGEHANYRKWYFTAQLDLDDKFTPHKSPTGLLLEEAKREWREKMESLSDHERFAHLALYLLIWGEAATLRYTPELLCFIFYVAECYRWHEEAVADKRIHDGNTPVTRTYFLDRVITPIYNFIRDQSYEVVNGHHIRRERDHSSIIGYDDINQFFWDRRNIASLRMKPSTQQQQQQQYGEVEYLKDIPREDRYLSLGDIDWNNTFKKTFYETRSWFHVLTNFSRVWVIHAASFWYYMAASADFLYTNKHEDDEVDLPLRLSIIGLGGLVAILLMTLSTLTEFRYLHMSTLTVQILLKRIAILLFFGCLHVGCSFYIIRFDRTSIVALIVSSLQLGLGALLSIVLVIIPSTRLFHRQKSDRQLTCQPFTANFPEMTSDDRFQSIMIWICVFGCKFLETYFFLALSFREALYVTVTMQLNNCSVDPLLGRWLCPVMPILATVLLFFVELILFFLDTYLWYVIWNTVFSVAQSMRIGISVMTSWKELFNKLPQNMFAKITSTKNFVSMYMRRMACSQMWNAIVISMFRDHLLSEENLQSLLYQVQIKEAKNGDKQRELHPPPIFDPTSPFDGDHFPKHSEAERRLSFFAQSLSTEFPSPCSVQTMPTFTVFTPHYAEKMVLSLREIIREEDSSTRVTLLEYLKRLHPTEWNNFVKDTKTIAEEQHVLLPTLEKQKGEQKSAKPAIGGEKDDLPFYSVGFKSSAPEYTMRTRIWASLRTQTLYRTINGFMNYARALKILYRIENPDLGTTPATTTLNDTHSDILNSNNPHGANNVDSTFLNRKKDASNILDYIAHQKFRFLVAMQRYAKFNKEEAANCEFLLQEYPQLQVAYIDEEKDRVMNEVVYYSVLIDGHCESLPNNKRLPKYRVRLPGNQLVDANQDNYLEECLKIRSIFGEFEQQEGSELSLGNVYALHTNAAKLARKKQDKADSPVAIVGAREYIFSENIGMLGDVAAGKEQTFGTLTQRIMAKTGGRLHYGHPDFLNAVYMTTRGGVSKAQRALHLNEDIYAGMNAMLRGGRIKHTEYLQCGKGRDLGFCSILNFTTKIGTGMGEQMLSREYYYLGTQLPLDRFLTFYYAHPGFHMNNIMIIFAVQIFLFCMTLVATMSISLPHCKGDDCFDVRPVNDWLQRCILSIFMVFFIAFLPLFLQELTEKGTKRSVLRLVKQFVSLSPLFEVFVTQIYANSVLSNLSFGGARYIATGRGFATSRIPFSVLYSRFAHPSIYFGARTMFILIFVSLALGIPHLIYFWATVASLMISPFVFNPHQFVFRDFINDYREFLGWLARGNSTRYHEHSWITFCRQGRTLITGIKKNTRYGCLSLKLHSSLYAMHSLWVPLVLWVELCLSPLRQSSLMMALLAHAAAVFGFIVAYEILWTLESFQVCSTLLGLLSMFAVQRALFKVIVGLFLTREVHGDATNRAWWSGRWRNKQVNFINNSLRASFWIRDT